MSTSSTSTSVGVVQSFVIVPPISSRSARYSLWLYQDGSSSTTTTTTAAVAAMAVNVGDLLCDLPTPCLLMELSLAESAVSTKKIVPKTEDHSSLSPFSSLLLDEYLSKPQLAPDTFLDGCLFIHTKVIDTTQRDEVSARLGASKSTTICEIDYCYYYDREDVDNTDDDDDDDDEDENKDRHDDGPSPLYLGIGLANHLVGGYYWARGMGMGASLPAHGVWVRPSTTNTMITEDSSQIKHCRRRSELYWKKRGAGTNAYETTEESSNSNDGKRSEWADFLQVGDTIQLVPTDPAPILWSKPSSSSSLQFPYLVGIRRQGRPLGADPIVEKIWERDNVHGGWTPMS